MFSFQNIKYNFLQYHCGHDTAECTDLFYPTGRHTSFLICLLCHNGDFSELNLHLNSTDVNRVPFHTTQKIRNLSSLSLGSCLICLYTTGPKGAVRVRNELPLNDN